MSLRARGQKRADLRVISRILELSHGISNPDPKIMSKIVSLYKDKGGMWSKFFAGDHSHVKLLKATVKEVLKNEQKRTRD